MCTHDCVPGISPDFSQILNSDEYADENLALVWRLYAERYLNRDFTSASVNLDNVHTRTSDRGNQKTVRTPEMEKSVLEIVGRNLRTKVRKLELAAAGRISHSLVWKVMHE